MEIGKDQSFSWIEDQWDCVVRSKLSNSTELTFYDFSLELCHMISTSPKALKLERKDLKINYQTGCKIFCRFHDNPFFLIVTYNSQP